MTVSPLCLLRQIILSACAALVVLHVTIIECHALINDSHITIRNKAALLEKRQALVRFVWGAAGFPADKLPTSIERNVRSPVRKLSNLNRVDALHISMAAGQKGLAHHFIPKKKNKRLVVFHLGHVRNCSFNDGIDGEPDAGNRRTLNRLLENGFSVLAVYMPQVSPDNCNERHDQLFSLISFDNPMKFFLEPTIVSLNSLLAERGRYKDVSMIGLSGGGWTTTLCAALDPRISLSIHLAGSLPLYLRWGSAIGHTEQHQDGFYGIAGYPDLYLMGSSGNNRNQIQVLNRHDDWCFGERQHNAAAAGMSFDAAIRGYELLVQKALKELGSGSFKVVIDETAPRHMISNYAIEQVIIPALK